jgi:hypothetical protein
LKSLVNTTVLPTFRFAASSRFRLVQTQNLPDQNVALILSEYLTMPFAKTTLRHKGVDIQDHPDSFSVGVEVVRNLMQEDLQHILILPDGSLVNGITRR